MKIGSNMTRRWATISLLGFMLMHCTTVDASSSIRERFPRSLPRYGVGEGRSLSGGVCPVEPVLVNFDKAANGTALEAGHFVGSEWAAFGLNLFAEGGVGKFPYLFDTENPGDEKCGDPDLGVPNEACPGGGPGKGDGGSPGKEGENCGDPMGLVLIVQEPGAECPDDNVDGGIITIDFPVEGGQYVYEIGLLDVDYGASLTVVSEKSDGSFEEYELQAKLLGDNSKQTIIVDKESVKWIKVSFTRSGAVTFVKFCPPPQPSSCVKVDLDFGTDADGNLLTSGDYVSDQYAKYGLTLSASGGEGDHPRLFDTKNPGSQDTCGDPDLGAPNEACDPSGPGIGKAGAPGKDGENCSPLGNALIVQEPGSECPDDNVDGGMLIFHFDEPAALVYEMGILDIDYESTLSVSHMIGKKLEQTVFDLELLGDNSFQTVQINIEDVKQIKLTLSRSGAVTSLSFCDPHATPSPNVSPSSSPTATPIPSPSASPSASPTDTPSASRSSPPTISPTATPTASPLANPSASPSESPSESPSASPTLGSFFPTTLLTASPTQSPPTSKSKSPSTSPVSSSPTAGQTTSPPAPSTPTSPPLSRTKPPSASPATSSPTTSPTKSPAGSLTSKEPCKNVTVSFDSDAEGNPLEAGTYVENEWTKFGFKLSASGGEGDLPRLFDTSNPGSAGTCGDSDLGAPNEACSSPGPGKGSGGAPGSDGENCEPLGNILIVQEPNEDCPDDNGDGGLIYFEFLEPAEHVYSMTFLDTETETSVSVTYQDESGQLQTTVFELLLFTDNYKQKLDINLPFVAEIKVNFTSSGSIVDIELCYNEPEPGSPTASPIIETAPMPTVQATQSPLSDPTDEPSSFFPSLPTSSPTRQIIASPTKSPTVAPTQSPTVSPTEGPCKNVTVSFDSDAEGNALEAGTYAENEWTKFGFKLSASGGEGDLPRLFDTSNPGSAGTCGDSDLGSPNEACSPKGPGIGSAGAPGADGENCEPLGNVLIVQEPNSDCPDDNVEGGMIGFEFMEPAKFVYSMTFLDIDYETSVLVAYEDDEGKAQTMNFALLLLGDNSKQTLEINLPLVKEISVIFMRSGAIVDLDLCHKGQETSSPTTSPTTAPAVAPTPRPTLRPTNAPTRRPMQRPTSEPIPSPTSTPTTLPTSAPMAAPSRRPTLRPTSTRGPTGSPTNTESPTGSPTQPPTGAPTESPTDEPTTSPTGAPTESPTGNPTEPPTDAPTDEPTAPPTKAPTRSPTSKPSHSPSSAPTTSPSSAPTTLPSSAPTTLPTSALTALPTRVPTTSPSSSPTTLPSSAPTISPSSAPTTSPSSAPTTLPTRAPTASPTRRPTLRPTEAPTQRPTPSPTERPTSRVATGPPSGGRDCTLVTVGFDKDMDGNAINAGTAVSDEWKSLGLILGATGGVGDAPHIFDTSSPGNNTCGDPDLGSPNEACSGGGPGKGVDGAPGKPGENCEPLGNVLIVQEPGSDCPDDNVNGGIITLDFPGGQYVKDITILDIDYRSILVVATETDGVSEEREIVLDLLGDNSVQTVDIDQDNVKWLKLQLRRSGAVTQVTFCPRLS